MSSNDSTLLGLASAGGVDSYAEIASRLNALDAELDPGDSLVWFNRWYAALVGTLVESARRHRFVDPVFVERVECHAAAHYFAALAAHLGDPGSGPSCWAPLLQNRNRPDVLPVQHAIAAVNAHVNHDLSVALVSTLVEFERSPARDAPAHVDYQRIAAIIDGVLCDTTAWLTSNAGSEVASARAQLAEVISIWSTERACEAAWAAAEVRWALRVSPLVSRHHLDALDRLVGLAGRSLLRPWHPCPCHPSPQIERPPSSRSSR